MNIEIFFNNIGIIENITQTSYITTSISQSTATYWGNYNGTHKVTFEWDVNTGQLKSKLVESESGKQIKVVTGKGQFFSLDVSILPMVVGIFAIFAIRRNIRKLNVS